MKRFANGGYSHIQRSPVLENLDWRLQLSIPQIADNRYAILNL